MTKETEVMHDPSMTHRPLPWHASSNLGWGRKQKTEDHPRVHGGVRWTEFTLESSPLGRSDSCHVLFSLLRQHRTYPKLVSSLLYNWRWSWSSDHPAPISPVLRLQVCDMPSLCSAENWIQVFITRQALYQLNHSPDTAVNLLHSLVCFSLGEHLDQLGWFECAWHMCV